MATESSEIESSAEGAVLTIPKEMLLRVRPPSIEGPVLYDEPRPVLHPREGLVLSQADVIVRHIVALERHIEQSTKLIASTAMGHVALSDIPAKEAGLQCLPLDPDFILSRVSVSRALRHCSLVFARLAGFRSIDGFSLDMLADLLHEFLSRIGTCLRAAQDREALRGGIAHVDSLNQALYDVGLPRGVLEVLDFMNSLRERQSRLIEDCRALHERHGIAGSTGLESGSVHVTAMPGGIAVSESVAGVPPALFEEMLLA